MADNNNSAPQGADRREFFRVDDALRVNIRRIDESEMKDQSLSFDDELVDNFTVMSSLASISAEMSVNLRRIEVRQPEIGAYLRALDRKIEVLGRAFLSQESELLDGDSSQVNLSAGGVCLEAREPYEVGSSVEVKLLLFPSFTGVLTYGYVRYCEPLDKSQQRNGLTHSVRIEFTHMRESDRDVLIRHVVRRQSDDLKKRQIAE